MGKEINLDSQDMKKAIDQLPSQIAEAYKMGDYIRVDKPVDKIVIIGMGGSAIAGDILQSYIANVPVTVIRDYNIPDWIDEKTLVFASSYSGNTEETISAYREARKKKALIVVITSGGRLLKLAQDEKTQIVLIPKFMQPRNAVAYMFFPMLSALENAKLLKSQDTAVRQTINALKKEGYEKIAKDLLEKNYNKIPIIYSSNKFSSIAYRWKTQFNENAKVMAFSHAFPELDHNAIMGFEHLIGHFHVIFLKSDLDHKRIQKRMDITEKLIRRKTTVTSLNIKGENYLSQLFTAIHIGDLTTYFLALRYRIDPSPVDYIEELKKEMGPYL
ncbi:bifunctional phosphoglucose/phosphomannose isomerase [Candidatus Woesearchaeota archaeon]|nr:MAG: bifunctional phosphoglucose/phosphomannose isomerase [Candidatus Woesearchaeota archaeon]